MIRRCRTTGSLAATDRGYLGRENLDRSRRRSTRGGVEGAMVGAEQLERSIGDQPNLHDLLALLDAELGNVYAFILRRCGDRALAEDLTSEVILRAVRETKGARSVVTPAWLTTVARNRLVDHWRSKAREGRRLGLAWSNPDSDEWTDDATPLEPEVVNQAMRRLPPDHQAVLSLRYLDDLTVPEVAAALGRSVHATESLLARARRAFRTSYVEQTDG
jgi:RNA polymerase sigma-70 factor, ECF subfamily